VPRAQVAADEWRQYHTCFTWFSGERREESELIQEGMLAQAASCEHSRHVGLLAGLLLGAAGVPIPTTGFNSLPDRDELDRIVEPFAQLVASGNFAV
jgi:hypothetical protein